MTCIVGIETEAGVVLAADSLSSSSSFKSEVRNPKLVSIPVHHGAESTTIAIGYTSSWRFGQIMHYHLETYLKLGGADDPDRWMVEEFVSAMVKALEANRWLQNKDGVVSGGNMLVSAYGRLYEVQEDLSVIREVRGYSSVGSGMYYALGALHVLSLGDNFHAQAIPVAEEAIKAAIALSPSVGGEIGILWLGDAPTKEEL